MIAPQGKKPKGQHDDTLQLVWILFECAAALRAGIASWNVIFYASGQNWIYTGFTVVVIEGVFIAALFLIGTEHTAPLVALFALIFSAAMQYLEVLLFAGKLPPEAVTVLQYVMAFAPTVILFFAFIRRIAGQGTFGEIADSVGNLFGRRGGQPARAQRTRPAPVIEELTEEEDEEFIETIRGNGRPSS